MVDMIKKYPWNEPNPDKRWWTDKDYSERQMFLVSYGRGTDTEYGNIDDLDPKRYDNRQMLYILYGRSLDNNFRNIDDLDPKLYDGDIFQMVSFTGKINIQKYKGYNSEEKYQKTLKTIKENNPEWLI